MNLRRAGMNKLESIYKKLYKAIKVVLQRTQPVREDIFELNNKVIVENRM